VKPSIDVDRKLTREVAEIPGRHTLEDSVHVARHKNAP